MNKIFETSFFVGVAVFSIIQMVYYSLVDSSILLAQAVPSTNPEDINQLIKLGPWGIVLIMAIKMVIDYLQKGKDDQKVANKIAETKSQVREGVQEIKTLIEKIDERNNKYREEIELLNQRVNELYNWHNVVDDDNVKIWYLRKSFTDAISKISDHSEETNKLFMKMAESIEKMSEVLYDIREDQKRPEKKD